MLFSLTSINFYCHCKNFFTARSLFTFRFWSLLLVTYCQKSQSGKIQLYKSKIFSDTQWAKSFHTRGKNGFPSLLGVHIVCEHPLWYYKRKFKEKICKSLFRKKLHAFFGPPPGFELTNSKIRTIWRHEPWLPRTQCLILNSAMHIKVICS